MSFFDKLSNFIFEDEYEEEPSRVITNESTTWQDEKSTTTFWQLVYAKSIVANLLSVILSNVDWKTYRSGKLIKEENWFKLNYAMNDKETSAEFFNKLAHSLIDNGNALIIENANKQFYVADSFAFQNGIEQLMKANTFTSVQIGNVILNRTYKENSTCMYIKAPQNSMASSIHQAMASDYMELKKLVDEGADKALGMKLNLTLNAQGKNKNNEDIQERLQSDFEKRMKNRNSLFLTYKGETLNDLTEKQRGSEVQQVIGAVENNIKINKEILTNVGNSYGIPSKFMTGDYTSDNDDIYTMAITMFAKPYLQVLSKKFTNYLVDKEDVIKGSRIEANLDSIKFVEILKSASAFDKLISSGAYTINEVREKVGDDPVTGADGDIRFITKNYATFGEMTKGGSNED